MRVSRRVNHGATIPEILVSAGLLLLLSALFFQAILPALQREDWFANKQSVITGFLAAKERLSSALRTSLLIPLDEHSVLASDETLLVEFYRQRLISTTDFAEMGFIDRRELPTFDTSIRHQIRFSSEGLLSHKTSTQESLAPIWFMGDGAEVTVTQSEAGDRLDFVFRGVSDLGPHQTTRWENALTLLIR